MKPVRTGSSFGGVLTSARSALEGLSTPKQKPSRGPGPIAVDFGVRSLKVLQLSSGEARTVLSAAEVITPDELLEDNVLRLAFQADELRGLISQLKPKSKRAVCSIPTPFSFVKHLQIPRVSGNAMRSAVRMSLASELNCDAQSIEPRHIVVRDDLADGKAEIIGIATARSTIDRLMSALRSAGLETVGMQPETLMGARSLSSLSTGVIDPIATTLCLDLGYGSTKAVVLHGAKIAMARHIEFGGRAMDELLARTLGCSSGAARTRRLSTDEYGRDGELPEMSEALEILGDEIAMCVRYHSALFPERGVSKAVLTGGESRHLGLCRYLARAVGVSAQSADPVSTYAATGKSRISGVDMGEPQPGWAPIVGLAVSQTEL